MDQARGGWAGYLPAMAIGVLVIGGVAAQRLLPTGEGQLLVRAPGGVAALIDKAGRAGAAIMAVPAEGFAILHGDAARIRAELGPAVKWEGRFGCL